MIIKNNTLIFNSAYKSRRCLAGSNRELLFFGDYIA